MNALQQKHNDGFRFSIIGTDTGKDRRFRMNDDGSKTFEVIWGLFDTSSSNSDGNKAKNT